LNQEHMEHMKPTEAGVAALQDAGEGTQGATPVLPALDAVTTLSHARAARIIERCGYQITGYTLEHKGGTRKAIVDGDAVRWFPDASDFARLMTWQEPIAPGTPPEAAIGDPLLTVERTATAPACAPSSPGGRPVLVAAPSTPLVDSVEEALGTLAAELGCVRNDTVPHNAGWFVPGRPTAFASALDAIKALFVNLKAGGTLYVAPPPREQMRPASGENAADQGVDHEQATLF
jgi:hypothetical protein